MKTKKNRQTNELIRKLMILICIAVITCSITAFIFSFTKEKIYDVKIIDASFTVGNTIGLSADEDALNFGAAPPGSTSTKTIVVYHKYQKQLNVVIQYEGEIAEVLKKIPPFTLEPNIKQNVSITAYANNNFKTYSGKIRILFIIP